VVNSAHLASLSSPDSDRWLRFSGRSTISNRQAQNIASDWVMAPVDEAKVPPRTGQKKAFIGGDGQWDEAAADAAVTGLARTTGATSCSKFLPLWRS